MSTLKITKTIDTLGLYQFKYYETGEIVVLETYAGSSLFLSALNQFCLIDNGNIDSITRWTAIPLIGAPDTTTTYLGLDGLRYKSPFPQTFFRREQQGTVPDFMTGQQVPNFVFVDISSDYQINSGNYPDNVTYIPGAMGAKEFIGVWKLRERYTAPANNDALAILKETYTGFEVELKRVGLELTESFEALQTANPYQITSSAFIVKFLFDNRTTKTTSVNNLGEFS